MHGGLLKDKQFIQGFIADSYIDIQAARLMTIHAAEKIDRGDVDARIDISAIKVFVPAAYHRVVDRAIQVWGAAGVSNDLPLAGMYQAPARCASPTAPTRSTRSSSPRTCFTATKTATAGTSATSWGLRPLGAFGACPIAARLAGARAVGLCSVPKLAECHAVSGPSRADRGLKRPYRRQRFRGTLRTWTLPMAARLRLSSVAPAWCGGWPAACTTCRSPTTGSRPRSRPASTTLRFPKRRTELRLARWTAKHAIARALGLDDAPVTLASIEIRAASTGAPVLVRRRRTLPRSRSR